MRERRTGGPSGRTLKHDVIFVPDNALVAAQADGKVYQAFCMLSCAILMNPGVVRIFVRCAGKLQAR